MSDNVDRLIKKLDGVKEHSDIFILLKDKSKKLEIKKYRYEGLAKSIKNDRVFLVVEDDIKCYDEDSFFGDGEYEFPTLHIIYLTKIKEVFTSEQEKDAYLFNLKCKQKGYKVSIRYITSLYEDEIKCTENYLSKPYIYFSTHPYEIGKNYVQDFKRFIVESCEETTYGELYKYMQSKNFCLKVL